LFLALLSIRKSTVSKVWNDKLFSDKNKKNQLGANILKTGLWISFTLGLIFIFSPKISLQLPKILSNLYRTYQFPTHKPKEDL
jgi:hypothetical protein